MREGFAQNPEDTPEEPKIPGIHITDEDIIHEKDKHTFIILMCVLCVLMLIIIFVTIKMSFQLAELTGIIKGYFQ